MSKIKNSAKCKYCSKDIIFIESGNPLKKKPTYCCEPDKRYVTVFQRGGKMYVTPEGMPIRGQEVSAHEWEEDAVDAYRIHWCDKFPGHINTGNSRKRRGERKCQED